MTERGKFADRFPVRGLCSLLCGSVALGVSSAASTQAEQLRPASPKKKIKQEPDSFSPTSADFLKSYQTLSLGPPPLAPAEINPDPGVPPLRPKLFEEEIKLQLDLRTSIQPPPAPPSQFNPDPGGGTVPRSAPPFFRDEFGVLPQFGQQPVPENLQLPRTPLIRPELAPQIAPTISPYGLEPVPPDLKLPRSETRANQIIPQQWHVPDYSLGERQAESPPTSEPRTNRWRIGFAPWRRYTSGQTETPYESPAPLLWHPYKQSLLKGDTPIIGPDIFLNLTLSSLTEFEARRLPTPSGVSSARAGGAEFFGKSEQLLLQHYAAFTVDLFKGETAFKPVEWAVHLQPIYNLNYSYTRETGVISPNPGGSLDSTGSHRPPDNSSVTDPGDVDDLLDGQLGDAPSSFEGHRHTTRLKDFFALQEGFVEIHLRDLSANYDFVATRLGNQIFNSDFRGFIFNDINLGARLFGNADNNHWQYNVVGFDMNEKDTNSELNSFDRRNQRVLIANLYRQDFLWKGYTAQLSFHANLDDADVHYDRNGNIVRPAPLGTVKEHDVRAYYLGWAGDGHIGRLNLTHAFYQVYGRDDLNGLAGRPVNIDARMAALELSYDKDWARFKASCFYASGDDDAEDGHGHGFDTILDNPNFTGGPFSYYVRQGFNLAGTSVNVKQRGSLVPNLRTSKFQGQANFVNPGIFLFGVGTELELTPRLRSFINVNYLRFDETDALKTALLTDTVDNELGWDCSIGFQYRPLLTDNIIISTGFGAFVPGRGYTDIYRRNTDPVPGFNSTARAGHVDDFLYSALLALTLTY